MQNAKGIEPTMVAESVVEDSNLDWPLPFQQMDTRCQNTAYTCHCENGIVKMNTNSQTMKDVSTLA